MNLVSLQSRFLFWVSCVKKNQKNPKNQTTNKTPHRRMDGKNRTKFS